MAQIIILTGASYLPDTIPRIERTLGAYRVASALIQSGYSVQVIDYIQYMSSNELINALSKYLGKETLWVGYSSTFFGLGTGSFVQKNSQFSDLTKMYSTNIDNITIVYDYIRKNSTAKIVFGGAKVLGKKSDPRVDYYVLGYSDISCVHLSEFLSGKTNNLPGTSILENGSTLLDSSVFGEPKMNNIKTDWAHESFALLPTEPVSLEFARGCIFKCKFCNYPLLGKKKGTYIRDMEEVRDNLLELWEAKKTTSFYITDDTFNDDNDKLEEFHKLFTSLPFKPQFSCFLRIDLLDKFPHQADLLSDAGLIGPFFGIESFNLKSARVIGKGLHPEKVKKRLYWLKDKWKNKVNISAGLIFGLPYDDDAYFKELYDFVTSDDYPIDTTSFSPLWIQDPKNGVNSYSSEFTMKPEIYGYSFDTDGRWIHDNGMTAEIAGNIAINFRQLKQHTFKVADFQMITYLALGVPLSDMLNLSIIDLNKKHNIPMLNQPILDTYKKLIGAI